MDSLSSGMAHMSLHNHNGPSSSHSQRDSSLGIADDEEKVIECHARIVSFFAHKGGVSKTTNVHHLGYMLAKRFGFKVLLVDADPQQNLTQTCCRNAKNNAEWRDDVDRGTIYTAVERLHYGMKDGDYIEPASCVRLHKKRIGGTTQEGSSAAEDQDHTGELWLLPGSLDLAKLEPQLTFAHNVTNPKIFPLFDDIAGGFRALLLSTCAHYNIDFCLLDMGPSIGELNKSLFWSSDYFIIPCSPDSYCKTTMKTMERTLPLWAEQQRRLAEITKDMTMALNPFPPKFLGCLMGLFQVSGSAKKPVKDSQHWMDIISATVQSELVPALRDCGMVHEHAPEDFSLAEIPHFLSLMPIAQRSHAPVFDVPDNGFCNQTEDGELVEMGRAEVKRHTERAKFFYKKYERLCEVLIEMFNAEEEEGDEEMGQENQVPL